MSGGLKEQPIRREGVLVFEKTRVPEAAPRPTTLLPVQLGEVTLAPQVPEGPILVSSRGTPPRPSSGEPVPPKGTHV